MGTPTEVLEFWFRESSRPRWFENDADFDREIAERFRADHARAVKGGCDAWQATPEGALALVIVLDQFSRNLFREDPRAFAADAQARTVAAQAIDRGFDMGVPIERRIFFYMPFEHSESLEDQRRCLRLVRERCNIERYIDYAASHLKVIERFGRFPHRNKALGRESTEAEITYMAERKTAF